MQRSACGTSEWAAEETNLLRREWKGQRERAFERSCTDAATGEVAECRWRGSPAISGRNEALQSTTRALQSTTRMSRPITGKVRGVVGGYRFLLDTKPIGNAQHASGQRGADGPVLLNIYSRRCVPSIPERQIKSSAAKHGPAAVKTRRWS